MKLTRNIHKLLMTSVSVAFLAGCNQQAGVELTPDFSYSNAGSVGTYNSGQYDAGSLFVWNIYDNKMMYVTTLELHKKELKDKAKGNLTSSKVTGFDISGIPTPLQGQKKMIEAEISKRTYFNAENAKRESYNRVMTALSDYVKYLVDEGQNADLTFHPRNNNYRVVIITSIVRSSKTELKFSGADGSENMARISLKTPVGDIGEVTVKNGSSVECKSSGLSETNPPCFFNVKVLDPHYDEGIPRLQWRTYPYPNEKLPDAFRALN